jgi:dimeric dUTPase (all-alpha-NTP-PPase superfamily)
MNNYLKEIWEEQKSFQKNFFDTENISEKERVQMIKENVLSTHRELSEILGELPTKLHRAHKEDYDIEKAREETIDCFKFLLNISILLGMTEESFYSKFIEKSKIVRMRYEEEKEKINNQK